jgi:hypothetical protein
VVTPVPQAPIDAGPQPLPGARLWTVTDAGDGGEADLRDAPDASVPVQAVLRFVTTAALNDVRIRILTNDDRLVDNDATINVDDGGMDATLRPLGSWPVRGCCTFRIDGEVAPQPSDGALTYLPFEVAFSVAPDPNAKPSTHGTSRRHHRHR